MKNKTHNKQFEELQDEYLKTRNPDILGKMYLVCRELQTNYLNNYCKKKKISFSNDDREDKIEDATIYVIEKYLRNPEFKVKKLSAYQYFGMLKQLFKDKNKEMMECRLDDVFFENEI